MFEAQRTVLIRTLITAPWRPAPLASVFAFHEIQPLPQLEQGGAPAQANLADRPRGANRPNWFYRGIIHDGATLRSSWQFPNAAPSGKRCRPALSAKA
jgi:hypothetical protein